MFNIVKKLMIKIITKRLFHILAEHKVLRSNNFIRLPDRSCEILIKILNNIFEDTRENNKKLWINLQNLSKAYDHVDLNFFKKALERIKIPQLLISFILSLFTNRKNKILTAIKDMA